MPKKLSLIFLTCLVGFLGLAAGERLTSPNPHYGFISTAEAIVGRPLTPVSGAGVARRTVRRCAAGVYNC